MKNFTIEFDLKEFLQKNEIELKEVLECYEDEDLYGILDKATNSEEFVDGAIGHIIDFIEDQYGFSQFVDDLSDEQKEELKSLL